MKNLWVFNISGFVSSLISVFVYDVARRPPCPHMLIASVPDGLQFSPGALSGRSWGTLGASLGSLLGSLGSLVGALGQLWGLCGLSLVAVRRLPGRPGASSVPVGCLLGLSGLWLVVLWRPCVAPWTALGPPGRLRARHVVASVDRPVAPESHRRGF